MRCRYCHNPETWKICTDEDEKMDVGLGWQTAKEAFDRAYRYQNYWKNNGGITVSGGEPLLQIDFVTELFGYAKEKGVHTTLDTSGSIYGEEPATVEKFEKLMEDENREKIAKSLKEYGFTYVTLDLMGYRTGSMNETL